MYRFSRAQAQLLFLEIEPFLNAGQRLTRIPPVVQFITALHFYCHGSYQKSVGGDRHSSLSQSSVSRCLHIVTEAIVNNLAPRVIKFPQTIEEITEVKNGFFEKFNFPGVVGAIDGTHISLFSPASGVFPPRLVYLNRKNFLSINCQIICDSNLKIININPRYPGSVHDSAIWQMCRVKRLLHSRYLDGDRTTWLLGDSGYPVQPFLMTPIIGADPDSPEGRYYAAHCLARNTVERCIGLLKGRFRCLLKDRTLHYKPEFAAKITIACTTLYNILKFENDMEIIEEEQDEEYPENDNLYQQGLNVRNNLIRNHFQ